LEEIVTEKEEMEQQDEVQDLAIGVGYLVGFGIV
jgi:hypothetical protein